MAYDADLAARIRELIVDELDVTEKRMFGGLAFLVGGHMSVTVTGHGALMVRLEPDEAEQLLAEGVEPVVMQGRTLSGWLTVDDSRLADDQELRDWVDRSVDFARSLPPKA